MPKTWSWKQFLKTSFFYILFMVAIVGSFFAFYLVDTVFRVQEIHITQTNRNVALFGIEALKGTSLFFVDEATVKDQIKKLNHSVKSIDVRKEYPNKLYIEVTHFTPFVYIQGDPGLYVLSDDATILEKQREKKSSFPVITYYQKLPFSNYQAGDKLDFHDILFTVNFLQKLQNVGVKITSIQIAGSHVVTFKNETQEILASSDKDLKTQQYQLERIVKELRIQGQDFTSLDIRFEKPIYVPKEKK